MRALRFEGTGQGVVLQRAFPEPELREGEAIIRPIRSAIGRSDADIAARHPSIPPVTLGREFVGIVEKVRPQGAARDVKHPLVGQRVVGAINVVCSECDRCRAGLSAHCPARSVLGLHGRDGCFADRFALPLRNLSAIPDSIDDDHAVFAENLAAALHAVQQIRIEGKPYITILGDGPIALLCAQLMSRLNASVRVLGRVERKLDLCAKWGIKHRRESDAGRREDQDVVVDCTGTAEGFDLAARLVRPRGKILVKGPPHHAAANTRAVDLTPIITREIEVIGSRCGSIPEAVAALQRRDLDVLSLITKRMKLDDGVEALRIAAQPEHIKVVLDS